MSHRQVVIVALSIVLCFETGTAWRYEEKPTSWKKRAEARVCCESKWNANDVGGGCCGPGWDIHCCDTSTCCYGEERIHMPTRKQLSNLYRWVVYINAVVLATTVVMTAVMLIWCCRSLFGYWRGSKVYPVGQDSQQILCALPTRYGTLLSEHLQPNDKGYSTTDSFGTIPYSVRADPPSQKMTYTRYGYVPASYLYSQA